MGFGAGVLISAVAFDLIEEAAAQASGHGATLAGEPSPPAFAPAA